MPMPPGRYARSSALDRRRRQPPMILGQIRAAAIRLRPDTRVKNGLDVVFRTDLAIKSSAGVQQYLLECLVVEICRRTKVRSEYTE